MLVYKIAGASLDTHRSWKSLAKN